MHTHHVHDDYRWEGQLWLRAAARGDLFGSKPWNPDLVGQELDLKYYKFDHYLKDMFFDSDTTLALLSTSPSVDPHKMLLSDDQMVATRNLVNRLAGTRRMFAHGVIWPSVPHYLPAMDRAATELKVDAWKGYTMGDVLGVSPTFDHPWRMDDEDLAYPSYEKAARHGVRNICVHKGVLPADYERFPTWRHATVKDVGKAARDWPQLNFHLYHAALRMWRDLPPVVAEFEVTGRLPWIDELAEIPQRYGVSNVYADVGLSFGALAVSEPRLAAAMLGKLIQWTRRRSRPVGHRLDLVRLPAVADRGAAPHRDPGRPAGEARLRAARARGRAGEVGDLRRQRRRPVRNRARCRRTPAHRLRRMTTCLA